VRASDDASYFRHEDGGFKAPPGGAVRIGRGSPSLKCHSARLPGAGLARRSFPGETALVVARLTCSLHHCGLFWAFSGWFFFVLPAYILAVAIIKGFFIK